MGYLGKEPRKDGGSLTLGATLDTNGNEVVLDADADTSITADTDDQIDFKTGGTDRLKIQSTSGNNVVIADGLTLTDGNLVVANGHGIDFSATADGSSASFSELFDDYEEGVFGTSVSLATSGSVTLNGSYNNIRYTKVGRLVTINGEIRISSVSSPQGGIYIALPFATQNTGSGSTATVVGTCIIHAITKQTDQVGRFVVTTGDNISYMMLQYETDVTRLQPQAQNLGLGNEEIVFTMTYTAA